MKQPKNWAELEEAGYVTELTEEQVKDFKTRMTAFILRRSDYVNYNEGYADWLDMMCDSDQLFQIEDKYYKQDPKRTV